ncbi:hypothetical protein SAMN05660909_02481 [Chitinophaga terrae (ex Kim and Jung 2007)]|uniref:Uncharacterized protein n=1 Tax=Chitinophaga terrae (ex Kim and Jung 2007) TaxID=408074 RepID=A0A1H4C5Y9_9BACT|nr:hypothetical protein [Chitinophaga terrae (ex Kim and Jung 2007)]GEP92246.1 hypothetical protein CTE07_38910 [Chitinophaga terrae (ex Kim and Jung 2007)]SEA55788.1 hypothetical protein SAMN05660909_02481 [Chitinophaga terrae (ex Kim and Jung 2007)]
MELSDFINHINKYIPTEEQIRRKKLDHNQLISDNDLPRIQDAFRLRINQTANNNKEKLDALISDTNIREVGIGMVQFYDEMETKGALYRCFADYDYGYEFAERLSDSKIVIVERDAYDMGDIFVIANSVDEFMQLLILITNIDRHQVYGTPIEGDIRHRLEEMVKNGVSKKWLNYLLPTLL